MASLRYLNTILTVLTLLVALHLWTLWTMAPDFGTPAQAAGIPDEGAQRQQIIDQLKLLNKRAEQIKDVLQSGKMRVTVSEPSSTKSRSAVRDSKN